MALKSGFYNAMNVGGTYDRLYNADDYKNVFAAFIKDGVRRSGADDFGVTAQGLVPTVKQGFAVCGGRWVYLDADFTMDAITPPVGDYSRIDAVVLRVDANEATRAASLLIRTGTPSSTPQLPAKDTTTGVTELILAALQVAPGATAMTAVDTRASATLCGWITTPVGYDDYFTSLDSQFDNWFAGVKNTLASTTLFKRYMWRTVLEGAASAVTFSIPQYDSTGVDIVEVYVNGLRETEGVDYTLSGSNILFTTGGGGSGTKIAGTEIVVLVYKSIDGTGLGSVADRITALENSVATLSNVEEYTYVCNGLNDNVMLSEIAQAWLDGGTDYGAKTIKVYGTFGASAAYAGTGTSASPYRWFDVGKGSGTNRKITFDFSACSQISINCPADTYNVVFYGLHANIIGANVVATGGAAIYMFSTAAGTVVNAEKCRFWITSKAGLIARGGTIRDCRTSLTTTAENAHSFNVLAGSLLRVFGGEHYAYAPTGGMSSVVYVNSAQTGAVALTYGMSCPTASRAGYVQSLAINCLTEDACCSFTDTITALTVTAPGQNIRGTIAKSKSGLM